MSSFFRFPIHAALAAATLAAQPSNALSPMFETRDDGNSLSACPGYAASNVKTVAGGMTADLTLAGEPCNVYGTDLENLTLRVEYQTDTRLHVIIQDSAQQVYQVPSSVFNRPSSKCGAKSDSADIEFSYVESPFSFAVTRRSNGEVLFNSSAASLVFEDQYVRLRTSLPKSPSLYGLGEHTDPFMLNTSDYTRTAWNRDAYGTPEGTNLYGTHPIYYDHRGTKGTHGVFLLNSNGMDVKIDNSNDQYLEYNILGGVLDFYFLAGPSPVEVAQQYSQVAGKSAMMPYWGLGFHQCRYGMRDVYEVAEVVANYSAAAIPLETMWTDIDYMDLRQIFTLDPYRFPLDLVRQLVTTLHERQQHYIVMVDPAVAYKNNSAFNNGVESDAFLKTDDGSLYKGVVWPGVTVFPDWFADNTQDYWNSQFDSFFSATDGVDIDALWIDMNEASNFCTFPCSNPADFAQENNNPPIPPAVRLGSPRPIPGFPSGFQPSCHAQVEFTVYAETYFGENILVYGSSITIGSGEEIYNAVPLSADNYPTWSGAVDMPVNTTIWYEYVRQESDGSFIYEGIKRNLTTGTCGESTTVNDTITTDQGEPSQKLKLRDSENLESLQLGDLHMRDPKSAQGSMMGLPDRNLLNPSYEIDNAAGSISNKTLNSDLKHQNGYVEYDTHNLYGAMMSEASRQAMLSRRPTVRPLIITRSTFAGSGRQVGKWAGDNLATWFHYKVSMAELLEFASLYQVPMTGSDVCGFGGDRNERLCARWATLGAFSPFYRNHREAGVLPHEFYSWGNESIVAEAARIAISARYTLLDYIYTSMYVQNQTGTPLVQPLFFAYPNDSNVNPISTQYLYGPGILVAPVTEENSTSTSVYFPNDVFYDFWTGHVVTQQTGSWSTLTDIDYTTIPLYYKGGNVVAQRASSANTTAELRKVPFHIVVAPGADGTASGSLYLDDGESLVQDAVSFIHFSYDASAGEFEMSGTFDYDAGVSIESIKVLGAEGGTHNVNIPLTGSTKISLDSSA